MNRILRRPDNVSIKVGPGVSIGWDLRNAGPLCPPGPSVDGLAAIAQEGRVALEQGELAIAIDRLMALAAALRTEERELTLSALTPKSTNDGLRLLRADGVQWESALSRNANVGELLDLLEGEATRIGAEQAVRAQHPLHDSQAVEDSPLVSADGLVVARSGRRILDQVSLSLMPGEILGIVGLNGAGKTHLLELLAMTRRPTRGTLKNPGLTGLLQSKSQVVDSIAFVPQTLPSFKPPLEAHLEHFLAFRGHPRRQAKADIKFVLSYMRIAHLRARSSDQMSGGELARCTLARVLLSRARLFLLDEPLASLDPPTRQVYMRRLRDMVASSEGVAAVVSSHDVSTIESVATRLLLLDGGRQIFYGTSAELREQMPVVIRVDTTSPLEHVNEALSKLDITNIDSRLGGYRIALGEKTSFTDVIDCFRQSTLHYTALADISGSTEQLMEGLH